jgi:hypothetical protein
MTQLRCLQRIATAPDREMLGTIRAPRQWQIFLLLAFASTILATPLVKTMQA